MATAVKLAVGVGLIATGVGAAEGAATLSTLGSVSAGADIVGGAMTLYGTATHKPEITRLGGIIGVAGMVGGSGLLGSPTAASAADRVPMEGLSLSANGDQVAGAAQASTAAAPNVAGEAGGGLDTGLLGAAPKAPLAPAFTDAQQLQKYSLISGAVSGAGQAYAARTNADIQKELQQQQMALEAQRMRIANSAGTATGVAPAGMLASPIPMAAPSPLQAPPPVAAPTVLKLS